MSVPEFRNISRMHAVSSHSRDTRLVTSEGVSSLSVKVMSSLFVYNTGLQ
jgi:hypothetical protein